jgi:hypothetical protein
MISEKLRWAAHTLSSVWRKQRQEDPIEHQWTKPTLDGDELVT